jgi:iron complex transport system substrate-binding protein
MPTTRSTNNRPVSPNYKTGLTFVMLVSLSCAGGCRQAPQAASVGAGDSAGLTFIDDQHRTVVIPSNVSRIVSLSPACTETLFAIGAGDKIVGVTKLDNFPAAVNSLPRVGGFITQTISFESIVALEPDLVVSAGSLQLEIIERLERLGIATIAIEPNTLPAVLASITRLGEVVDSQSQAEELTAKLQGRLDQIEKRFRDVPRPSVYYEVASEPMVAAGPKSFLGELVTYAGGTNIFADSSDPYPIVNSEGVIRRDPEVILVPNQPNAVRLLLKRDGWHLIRAVQNKRVMEVNEDIVSRAGPRIVDGLEMIAEAIHATP